MDKNIARFWEAFHEFTSRSTLQGGSVFYRGVSNESHQLLPSISRIPQAQVSNDITSLEERMLSEFKRLALPELKVEPSNDFEWIFLAQHYGLPTRLLDWTVNPLVALFFAIEKSDDLDAKIFKCNHALTISYERFDYKTAEVQKSLQQPIDMFQLVNYGKVIFIQPPYKDSRYINQKSVFSCQSEPLKPLDIESIEELKIDKDLKIPLREQLKVMGVSHSFIYPGLDGVTAEVKKHIFEPVQKGRSSYMRLEMKVNEN